MTAEHNDADRQHADAERQHTDSIQMHDDADLALRLVRMEAMLGDIRERVAGLEAVFGGRQRINGLLCNAVVAFLSAVVGAAGTLLVR